MEEIELLQNILSSNNLIDKVFGNCLANENHERMKDKAILAPLNKDVQQITTTNDIVAKLPGEYKIYYSHDSLKDQPEGALEFITEFLNSVKISDVPITKATQTKVEEKYINNIVAQLRRFRNVIVFRCKWN